MTDIWSATWTVLVTRIVRPITIAAVTAPAFLTGTPNTLNGFIQVAAAWESKARLTLLALFGTLGPSSRAAETIRIICGCRLTPPIRFRINRRKFWILLLLNPFYWFLCKGGPPRPDMCVVFRS